jgi:uncharacterized integral membrane protein
MSAATRRAYLFGLAAEPLFLAILWPHRLWTAERLLWQGVGMLVVAVLLELVFAGVGYVWRYWRWGDAP